MKGGLEKYPKSKLFDQSQYCASSTERLRGEFKIDIILIINIISKNKKVLWTLNSKILKYKKKFFYLLMDASFIIHFSNSKKFIPLKAAISGTNDNLVIPGWVFISKR